MKAQVYLGVDLGAESGRVMAGLWNGRRIQLEEVHRFSNGGIEIGGSLRWNILGLWNEMQNGLSTAARRYGKSICSVGVDTWGVDYVLLSKSNELLGLPYHYRDERTKGVMEKAFRSVSRAEIFANSGVQFMQFNTLYQVLAAKNLTPEIFESADQLLMIPDFLHWCMSGVRAGEFTNATTTQFFHPTKQTWSKDLLKKFELPTRILPQVVQPGTKLGRLTARLGARTGLERIPVIAPATHDTGSAVAAVPAANGKARVVAPSWAYLSSGTWSLMGLEVPKAQLSSKALNYNLTNEGGVDGTYRLLKNIAGLWLVQQCRKGLNARGGNFEYPDLVKLAEGAPALRSFVDPDDSSFVNPPDMVVAIQAFCRRTRQPVPKSEGAVVRCALESLALRYAVVLDCLEDVADTNVQVIHIVGGGSRNSLLNQFTADACRRQVLAGPVEATVLGNVLMQARAVGEVSSLEEIRDIVRESTELRVFEPKDQRFAAWEAARQKFADVSGS